ncbi:MAG TPA: lipid-binding SYLF domain-containing protein [Candidatus Limnocylindrales bacterium]|nr:lipid-binding SYLF domain-containing protein [Candidatus Limnocylindrales bacterium]
MRKHMLICGLVATGLVTGLAMPAVAGTSRRDDMDRIRAATDVFRDIVDTPDSSVPLDLLQSAQCIAIIPGELRFAFMFGGNYGKGLVTCRVGEKPTRTWSAPAFVMIGGGGFGFQIGGASTDLILVFRNHDGLTKLLSDKFKIGGEATAAAGPVGRHAGASTDLQLHAEILTYSRSRGLFAGISLNGAVFKPDQEGDEAMYGSGVHSEDILEGKMPAPRQAQKLLAEIQKYAL